MRWMMTLASSVLVPLLMAKFRMHTRTSFPNGREDWPEIFRFVDKFEMVNRSGC